MACPAQHTGGDPNFTACFTTLFELAEKRMAMD